MSLQVSQQPAYIDISRNPSYSMTSVYCIRSPVTDNKLCKSYSIKQQLVISSSKSLSMSTKTDATNRALSFFLFFLIQHILLREMPVILSNVNTWTLWSIKDVTFHSQIFVILSLRNYAIILYPFVKIYRVVLIPTCEIEITL